MEAADEQEVIRHAMSLIGRRTSERKKATSADNLKKAREKRVITEAMREKMRAAQQARRNRERADGASIDGNHTK